MEVIYVKCFEVNTAKMLKTLLSYRFQQSIEMVILTRNPRNELSFI